LLTNCAISNARSHRQDQLGLKPTPQPPSRRFSLPHLFQVDSPTSETIDQLPDQTRRFCGLPICSQSENLGHVSDHLPHIFLGWNRDRTRSHTGDVQFRLRCGTFLPHSLQLSLGGGHIDIGLARVPQDEPDTPVKLIAACGQRLQSFWVRGLEAGRLGSTCRDYTFDQIAILDDQPREDFARHPKGESPGKLGIERALLGRHPAAILADHVPPVNTANVKYAVMDRTPEEAIQQPRAGLAVAISGFAPCGPADLNRKSRLGGVPRANAFKSP
jgi:hypothetical protein